MKMSLLDMVQDILNDMDSDEVGSISDTVESEQVAQILKTTYFSLISSRNWPHLRKTVKFTSLYDSTRPTHLKAPEGMTELVFINYNNVNSDGRNLYEALTWLEPDEFLRKANSLNSTEDNVVEVTDLTGIKFYVRNDTKPVYYTSFDDEHIVLDSYDSSVDSTIQESKVQALAYMTPAWQHTDNFIPDLPSEAFIALLEKAKSRASLKLKQVADQLSEQEGMRQQRWLSRKAWKVKGGIKYPNYGRKSRKGG